MSKQKVRQRRRASRAPHSVSQQQHRLSRRKVLMVICIALLLSITGILAQWRSAQLASNAALVASVPTSTPSPLSLSKEYIYAGGKLIATEEPSNISTLVTAPAALLASTTSTAQINLSWTASNGSVAYYQIERSANLNGPYALLPSQPNTNAFADTGVTVGTAYLYRVRAVDTSGYFSPYSNVDLATAVTFLDDPLASAAPIKAQHLVELRQAVNAVRVTAGLGPASWTDAAPQGARIKALHVQELRTMLDQALAALNLPIQSYTDPNLTNARVKKEHFEQLRQRVK